MGGHRTSDQRVEIVFEQPSNHWQTSQDNHAEWGMTLAALNKKGEGR